MDAVAVCDHGTIRGAIEVRRAAEKAGVALLVIVAAEILTGEGEIQGLFLTEEVAGGLTPEETIERIRAQGGLVCIPHPFDRYRTSALDRDALERVADRIDAVEALNARNLRAADDRAAARWAQARGIPVLAGSDAHLPSELGRVRTWMPAFTDAESFRVALPGARVEGRRSSPLVHVPTVLGKRTARIRRRLNGE